MVAAPPVQVGQKQQFAHGGERETVPSAMAIDQQAVQIGCDRRVIPETHDLSGEVGECGFEDADFGS